MTKASATSAGRSARREPRQTKLERYFARVPQRARAARPRRAPIVAARGDVVALWDASRTALAAWEAAGFVAHYVFSLDAATALDPPPVFACAFPDSTDLSIAGARWFSRASAQPPLPGACGRRLLGHRGALPPLGLPVLCRGPRRRPSRAPVAPARPHVQPLRLRRLPGRARRPPATPGHHPAPRRVHALLGALGRQRLRPPAQRAVEPAWRYYYSARHRAQRRMNPVLFARGDEGRRARACPRARGARGAPAAHPVITRR